MADALTLPFRPEVGQLPATNSTAENKVVGGQRGGGKTAWLAGRVVHRAWSNPACNYVVLRNDRADFVKTTLLQILKFLPGREKEDWVHNKTDSFIKVRSVLRQYWTYIWYVEGKDPNSYKGGNISGVYGDEADEIPYATIAHLSGSLRESYLPELWDTINPLTGQVFGRFPAYEVALATNPSPSWLMDEYPVYPEEHEAYHDAYADDPCFDAFPSPLGGDKKIDPDFAYFPFKAEENSYNPPGYLERLRRIYAGDPVLLARMVEGRWDATMEGLVYRMTRAHRWNSADPDARLWNPDLPVVLGVDPSNGSGWYACMVLQFSGSRIFVVDEFAVEAALDEQLRDWLKEQPYYDSIIDCVVDNALPATVRRLRELGIPARPCGRKDIIGQINAVAAAMVVDPDTGQADLLIDDRRCPHLRMEMGRRIYEKPREGGLPIRPVPRRGFDDCLKALEYPIVERRPTGQAIGYRQPATQSRHFTGRRPQPHHPLMTGRETRLWAPRETTPIARVGPQYRASVTAGVSVNRRR